ncbi:SCO4226 family nickel-binding protein [Streptomyces capparidis]|jgi:RecB family exonuclease
MATYIDIHRGMQGITAEQLREAHRADLAIEGEEGVRFRHAWADPESGTVYCLSDGPSAEAVQRVHQRTGHPADEIHHVPLSV